MIDFKKTADYGKTADFGKTAVDLQFFFVMFPEHNFFSYFILNIYVFS